MVIVVEKLITLSRYLVILLSLLNISRDAMNFNGMKSWMISYLFNDIKLNGASVTTRSKPRFE